MNPRTHAPSALRLGLAAALLLTGPGVEVGLGQESAVGWNDARVLDLVERGRQLRWSTVVDSAFRAYQADARGYVYFFIDRPDSDERTLIKADQIALEVFWHAPNFTRQRIVGLRDEKLLPTNINYHLDHLTVVQDDFGDFIRLGDGDEVEQVLHPLGPRSSDTYDFQLADSLTLRYGGGGDEVRVYEVRVRPKDFEAPGFVGSVYLDRANGAVVRMSFTFTPVSYVDPYLDYIRISLDNSLWLGKYWLPYRQEAELRRELPALDFLAGSIIRGRFEISGYDFNVDLMPQILAGRGVTAVPRAQRESFPFERGLFDDLQEEGLAPTPSLDHVRAQALEMAGARYMSGLAPLRLHLPSFSEALRYNRAEGLYLGAGTHIRPGNNALLRLSSGYAFGSGEGSVKLAATSETGDLVPTLEAYWHALRLMGAHAGSSGLVNTLATTLGAGDYLDPYYADGMRLAFSGRSDATGPRLALRFERHGSAEDVISAVPGSDFRGVRPVQEGILGAVDAEWVADLPWDGRGVVQASVARLETTNFQTVAGSLHWDRESEADGWKLSLDASAGAVTDGAPPQALFLLGGRGTLPGYGYRSFVGRRYGLVRAEGSHPLRPPWVGLRAFAALGATSLPTPPTIPGWDAHDSAGLRPSVGVGLSLGWDVLRLDLARGLRDGGWELIFSVDPRFHDWL